MPASELLFVHGALADERMWSPHIAHLHGRIGASALTLSHFAGVPSGDGPFDPSLHSREIVKAARGANLPVSLVAWSYSALPAALALLEAPDAFAQLLLFETGHAEWIAPSAEDAPAFAADAEHFYGAVFAAMDKGLEEAARAMIDGSGGAGAFDRQPAHQRKVQMDNLPSLVSMFQGVPPPALDRAALAACPVPITVWWGSNSRPVFSIPSRHAATCCGDQRSGIIAGVDHLWPILDQHGFADAVLSWATTRD